MNEHSTEFLSDAVGELMVYEGAGQDDALETIMLAYGLPLDGSIAAEVRELTNDLREAQHATYSDQ